ncbi:MAG TPA: YihY/virulence factor BrkB family protein [Novosphingobium sp.]|nr:YihY/virulence factor BrkB family protein [Novosphingobium sp.]
MTDADEGPSSPAAPLRPGLRERVLPPTGRRARAFAICKRAATGAYNDGFIHAGNLAYMAILSLFPFFIAVAAIFAAIGEDGQREASIDAFLSAVPPAVAQVLSPVAHDVVEARQGWLLWIGGFFGLWTAGSLIETIRDILHRAYKVRQGRSFWHYRLASTGLIMGSVVLLLVSLSAQVVISAVQEILFALFPRLDVLVTELLISRLIGAGSLFLSIYLLFFSLTPGVYQRRRYPKWPGALLVTIWWVTVLVVLPRVLRSFLSYDLTYGSLAGVMIALFFFWLVGLGMVAGAELNAALAVDLDEQDMLDAAEDGGGNAVTQGNREIVE